MSDQRILDAARAAAAAWGRCTAKTIQGFANSPAMHDLYAAVMGKELAMDTKELAVRLMLRSYREARSRGLCFICFGHTRSSCRCDREECAAGRARSHEVIMQCVREWGLERLLYLGGDDFSGES